MGQIGDKTLRTVNAGGGSFIAVVIPQFQPDIAVAFVVHHSALLVVHRLHGGVGDQVAGGGAEHLQSAVLVVKGDGVTHDAGSVQRCHLTGNKVVQIIAEVAARAPCDHIAREIAAGLVVEGADEGAVHGGEIPQLVAAIAGLEAGSAAAAHLPEAGKELPGGGVIERFIRWLTAGVAGIQLHPVVQNVRCIGNAHGSSGVGMIDLRAIPCLGNDPAVQGGFVIPRVLGEVCRAGIAVEHQNITAHNAAVGSLRGGQGFAGGKVDHLRSAVEIVAVLVAAVYRLSFLQHQKAVLDGGTLLSFKGHYFAAAFVEQAAAASAPGIRIGPGAEPVVCFAGHGILQKVHIFAAEGLVQGFSAAKHRAAVAGTVVTVKHPQPAVIQPGTVVKQIPIFVGGYRGSRRSRLAGSGRQHAAAAAEGKAQRHAGGSAADAGNGILHKDHSFERPETVHREESRGFLDFPVQL